MTTRLIWTSNRSRDINTQLNEVGRTRNFLIIYNKTLSIGHLYLQNFVSTEPYASSDDVDDLKLIAEEVNEPNFIEIMMKNSEDEGLTPEKEAERDMGEIFERHAVDLTKALKTFIDDAPPKEVEEALEPAKSKILSSSYDNACIIYGPLSHSYLIQELWLRDEILRKALSAIK